MYKVNVLILTFSCPSLSITSGEKYLNLSVANTNMLSLFEYNQLIMRFLFKKTILFVVLLFVMSAARGQVRLDFRAGVNYSTVTAKLEEGGKASTSYVPGIYLGLSPHIQFSDRFALQPAVIFAQRGYKSKDGGMVGWGKDFRAHISYWEFPIDLVYTHRIRNGDLMLGLGPFIGFTSKGKWRTSEEALIGDIAIGDEGDIIFQEDASDNVPMGTYVLRKSLDYGAHLRASYLFKSRYIVGLDFQQGFVNLAPKWGDHVTGNTTRNHSMALSIGYRL